MLLEKLAEAIIILAVKKGLSFTWENLFSATRGVITPGDTLTPQESRALESSDPTNSLWDIIRRYVAGKLSQQEQEALALYLQALGQVLVKVEVPGDMLSADANEWDSHIARYPSTPEGDDRFDPAGVTPSTMLFDPKKVYRLVLSSWAGDHELAGLSRLSSVKNLRSLAVSNSHMTDKGLKHFWSLRFLEKLWVARCKKITDDGLAGVANLKNLVFLGLEGCSQVSDGALTHLEGLKKLQALFLGNTRVTEEGGRKLERVLGRRHMIEVGPFPH